MEKKPFTVSPVAFYGLLAYFMLTLLVGLSWFAMDSLDVKSKDTELQLKSVEWQIFAAECLLEKSPEAPFPAQDLSLAKKAWRNANARYENAMNSTVTHTFQLKMANSQLKDVEGRLHRIFDKVALEPAFAKAGALQSVPELYKKRLRNGR